MKFDLESLGITKDDILERIANEATSMDGLLENIRREVRAEMVKSASQQIGPIIADALRDIMTHRFTPVDCWGEAKGKETCLRDMVKDRCVGYLKEKVDASGRASDGYNAKMTRGEWIAQAAAREVVDSEAKEQVRAAVEVARKEVFDLLSKHVSQILFKTGK